jgi:hypothetical protein
MAPPINQRAELQRLLQCGDFVNAKNVAADMLRRNPRDGEAWLGVARCAIGLNRLRVAEEALGRAERMIAGDHRIAMAWAIVDHYLARSDKAIDRLRVLISRNAPNALDAHIFLADILHRTGRRAEMKALVEKGGVWLTDVRGRIMAARVRAKEDREGAVAEFEAIVRAPGEVSMRRNAGFEGVQLLDSAGEYRRAWELAVFIHENTSSPFNLSRMHADVQEQRQLLAKGKPWFTPQVAPVEGIAFIVGMPRSGTTLLEQMLDRHSCVAGIGEYEGIMSLGDSLHHVGAWPQGLGTINPADAAAFQNNYLAGARTPEVAGKAWLVDKALQTWRWLPAVAAILPGARCMHIARDPRDTAVSLYLSSFNPTHFGWTGSLDGIREVMTAERGLALEALSVLNIPHEEIIYEDLAEDPNSHAERVTKLLGLSAEPAMLKPEENTRTVLTLSHEQVRRPINKASISRWKNYESAFGPEWDALVADHEARRRCPRP